MKGGVFLGIFVALFGCGAGTANVPATFRVAHITDMHIDPGYKVGSNPLVPGRGCHDPIPPSEVGKISPAGKFGDVHCDAPPVLVDSAVDALLAAVVGGDGADAGAGTEVDGGVPPTLALYWTGDDVAHLLYNETTRDIVTTGIRLCADAIGARFAARKEITLVASLGNHDCYPTDEFSANLELYKTIGDIFLDNGFLEREHYATFLRGGYYARALPGTENVLAVSLNTILWYSANTATDPARGGGSGGGSGSGGGGSSKIAAEDPAGQFAWLVQTLDAAVEAGQTVHLLGHVPPGFDENSPDGKGHMHPAYNERFVGILQRYAAVIQAGFYGHEHTDAFRAFVTDNVAVAGAAGPLRRAVAHYAFLAPSITPWANSWHVNSPSNNPAAGRLYTIGRRVALSENPFGAPNIDLVQIAANLSRANIEGRLTWGEEYTASETYTEHRSEAGGVNWVSLATAMLADDSDSLFGLYRGLNMVSMQRPTGGCNAACEARMRCATVCALPNDLAICERGPAAYAELLGTSERSPPGLPVGSAIAIFAAVLIAAGAFTFIVTRTVRRNRAAQQEENFLALAS
jgi:hypothetical protein